MDEYRRMLAIQSIHEDHVREAQADRRSHWLLGRPRHAFINVTRVWMLLTLLGLGLFIVWGH